jgi:hypothetical protein
VIRTQVPAFERANTVHASDRAVTVIGHPYSYFRLFLSAKCEISARFEYASDDDDDKNKITAESILAFSVIWVILFAIFLRRRLVSSASSSYFCDQTRREERRMLPPDLLDYTGEASLLRGSSFGILYH